MAYITTNVAPGINLAQRLRTLRENYKAARARRAAIARAYSELNALSERELLEFGLHRSDLMDLARQSV